MSEIHRNNLLNKSTIYTLPACLYNDKQYNNIRRCIMILIGNIIYNSDISKNIPKLEKDKIIENIEKSCYITTLSECDKTMCVQSWNNSKFVYLYRIISSKVTKNLDPTSEVNSSYLLTEIKNKNIDIDTIASLSSEKLCPDKSKKLKEKIKHRSLQKIERKRGKMYTCRICKRKETTVETVQLRALDEGSSYSITCVFCQHNWIIS